MASRSRKTILSNPLDDINPQSVSKVSPSKKSALEIQAPSSKKSTAKKTFSKLTKTTPSSAKKNLQKKTSVKETPVKKTALKTVKKDAEPSVESAQAMSKFDELAEVLILDATNSQAKANNHSKSKKQSSETIQNQPRADDVFDAELSKEPPCGLIRVRLISDRQTRAMKVVKTWSQWSVAAGIVPVPLMDVALVSGIQVKMIYDLCQIYSIPFEKKSALAVASGLVGGSLSSGVARIAGEMALKTIPYVEQVLQPTLAFATTYSMGYVFVKHFESSGTLLNFDTSKMNIYFQEQFEKSKKLFSKKQAATA
ncbi:MAG: DUF697 domain-containing protein [Burkholderiaceae bacterium]|jgi:uncharacterized protein (DUF697 family)|nr:DUF697 domain-containing protein [Burkholderiaceae bacterium]MDP4968522.1 DUF697 domain-containing protein [Burkholderiaceae bacterium]